MKKYIACVMWILSTTLNTVVSTDEVTCDGKWTKYFNRDVPSEGGDFETLAQVKYYFPGEVCDLPSAVDARIAGTDVRYTADSQQLQLIEIGPDIGFKCRNTKEICYDYEVNFCCPEDFDKPLTPSCAGVWTRFFNNDYPDGDGDYETIPSLRCKYPGEICQEPLEIDARIAATDWDYRDARQVVEVNRQVGLRCDNVDQLCEDYKVRFCCLETPPCTCPDGEWTRFFDADDPGEDGDFETLEKLRNLYPDEICESLPSAIDVRTVDGDDYRQAQQEVHISLDRGFVCNNTFPIEQECCDYKVRFCCKNELDACTSSPCQNDATCVPLSGENYECQCPVGYDGDDCENELDACASSPCQNDATCVPLSGENYECQCPVGYDGDDCETRCCVSSPCQNDATCVPLPGGNYECQCPLGYDGDDCEIKLGACASSPCQNDATCVPLPGENYECQCPVGFDGDDCEIELGACVSSPCQNDATCVPLSEGNYECVCPVGYDGDDCEIEINACDSSPCQNDATCVPLPGENYECQCPLGYGGDDCQIVLNHCVSLPCENNGTCVPVSDGDYECHCAEGFDGKDCEIELNPCVHVPCENDATCVPVSGGTYECQCAVGYDGDSCEDRNDCDFTPCSENEICIPNPDGGFECRCDDDADDHECDDGPPNCWQTNKDGITKLRSGDMALCQEGWRVFDRRYDGSQDFYLYWEDYKNGFGSLDSEYWLGLETLHNETSRFGPCRMRIDMWNYGNQLIQAHYGTFAVASEKDFYKLTARGFSGTAGNALHKYHNQMYFSTRDEDHDQFKNKNCADKKEWGGFWYSKCFRFAPHAPWSNAKGGAKMKWKPTGAKTESLRAVTMMFRCD